MDKDTPAPKSSKKAPATPATSKKSAGQKPAAAAAKKAAKPGVCAISDAESGIDFHAHICRVSVTLPLHAPKLLMLEVVEKVAAAVMVRATPGIEKVRHVCENGVTLYAMAGGR